MAAVTFSGFNDIDFNQVVTAIMDQESQPLTTLQTQKTTLDSQNTLFTTLATRLSTLKSATDALATASSVTKLTASSSDAGVGVSTTSGTVQGNYDVVVTALARRQVTASSSTYAATTDVVATGGQLTLTAGDGTVTTFTIGASTTLADLASQINDSDTAPVTASLVQSAPGSYQLVLTGRETGADNAFTVASTLTGGTGLAFTDTDNDGISGDSDADNVQSARNAALTVNGLAISSATNTVSEVIPGATLTLNKEDAGTIVRVGVSQDVTGAKDLVQKVITAYNSLLQFLNDQRTADAGGSTNINDETVVRGLRTALRSTLMGEYANDGSFARLAEIGIGFDSSGKMVLDSSTFQNAMADGVTDVQTLLAGSDGTGGAMGALATMVNDYVKSGGLVADARDRMTAQSTRLSDRIDLLQEQLDRRRAALQQEFLATDQLMTQLNSQVSSLSALSDQYRLF